jgi:Rod binding domain-containing protein
MKFPAAPDLKPLDLARTPRAATRPLVAGDLAHASRLAGPVQTQHDRIVGQTEKWVAQTFFGTLLKQMENSPFKSDLFSGGRGGQAFSSLYHEQLTERMARSAGSKLVNTIVRKIEATAAYQKQQNATRKAAVPPAPPTDFGAAPRNASGRPSSSNGRRDVAIAARA